MYKSITKSIWTYGIQIVKFHIKRIRKSTIDYFKNYYIRNLNRLWYISNNDIRKNEITLNGRENQKIFHSGSIEDWKS